MRINKPIIGVTSNLEFVKENISYTLYYSYLEAIKKAGGIPIVLTLGSEEMVDRWVEMIDGLLLTGGNDIHPKYYDGDLHPELGLLTPKLDQSDMMVIKRAYEERLPMLGICRGSHLINVALGGTLLSDIKSELTDAENHFDKGNREKKLSHKIYIEKDSILYSIYHQPEIEVNSFHHQAIDELGKGLKCTAHAADGVIEAFESIDGTIMGTQFHPEELRKFDYHMHQFLSIFIGNCKKKKEGQL
ncbi:gamma-glutamyl-gamma-aminobutyrate hydrolase family protein [Siminovitchia sediminis]|uniref:Gamma-glutamyl-gamma-aminobutyrate hydrolase family protein n=1 Tax=Siminovitchia sediminis TaxID=1274353 RepID=A0ABW4KAH2_9BACI